MLSLLRGRALRAVAPVVAAGVVIAGVLVAAPAQAALSQPAGVRGFDISEPTGANIDFAAAKGAGAQFVYIKASGGVLRTNDNFEAQLSGAQNAGLMVGTYHLAAPNTASGARQAEFFADHDGQWHAGGQWLPPMLDVEKNTDQKGVNACFNQTSAQLVAWIKSYAGEVQSLVGRAPIIYAGKDFTTDCLGNTNQLSAYQLFVPNYTQNPTTVSGGLAASWASFSFWQYSDAAANGIPGDQDVFNGTLASLHLLADPTYGSGTAVTTRNHDYSGDGKNDVLTRASDGSVRMWRGTGRGGFTNYAVVGKGLGGLTAIAASGDFNGDGVPDILGRMSNGGLYLYTGKRGGGFNPARLAATGMNSMNLITGVGDFNGDGKADVLTRDSKGVLWLYEGSGSGLFVGRVQVGSNASVYKQIIGVDNFGTGHSKGIVTEDAAGTVRFSARTSTGFAAGVVIGTGWNAYNTIVSPGDLTGDGVSDLLARRPNGEVSVYPGTGASKLKPRVVVANGWSVFNWIG